MSKMVYEQPIREHSSGSNYRLFLESRYYFVWLRKNGDNWKIRVDTKLGCVHCWADKIYKNKNKWTIKKHPLAYRELHDVEEEYFTIEVDYIDLRHALADVVKGIFSEYGGYSNWEVE